MARATPHFAAVAALLLAFAPPPAHAQPGMPRSAGGASPPSGAPSQHATPTLSTSARVAWPRLDPGAILCRTRDDLRAHAQVVQARAGGTPYTGSAPNCRVLGLPAAIDILTRESPAATEVKLKDAPGGTGWTDTWLPNTPPR